jgi:hypothetical protein
MSGGEGEGRGWIVVLVAMGMLTAGLTAAYVAAPFDPPPGHADTGGPDLVDPKHRIAAVTDDGLLVVIDARDGSVAEAVRTGHQIDPVDLEIGTDRETAYTVSAPDGAIDAVRLRTGHHQRRATGRAISLGLISFPQLPRTVERPDVEQLAYVDQGGRGIDAIVLENLTTGEHRRLEAASDDAPFGRIDDLVLSPFDNWLFGIADGGTVLFRLDTERVEILEEAVVARSLRGIERFVDATPFADGVAAIVETGGGDTAVVVIDRQTLDPVEVLLEDAPDRLTAIDADVAANRLLVVTEAGDLLRLSADHGWEPQLLAEDVRLAAW